MEHGGLRRSQFGEVLEGMEATPFKARVCGRRCLVQEGPGRGVRVAPLRSAAAIIFH